MNFGKNIKFHRLKQGQTQEELAAGLISVSYLSKIENEQITPSPDIIEELLNRLKIQPTVLNDADLMREIKEWYQSLLSRDISDSMKRHNILSQKVSNNNSFESVSLYNLVLSRYFLTLGKLQEAEKTLDALFGIHKELPNEILFYLYKFKGNLYYLKTKYPKAYENYKKAELLFSSSTPPFEKADVYYSLGLSSSQMLKPYLGIFFAKQALEIFRSIYRLDRSCDCHLLLGISYQRLREFEEAEFHYKWSDKIAKDIGYSKLYGMIEHNLGYFYYMQGSYHMAIDHYQISLELKENDNSVGKLTTIIAIIKVYYKLKQKHELSHWLKEAEAYINFLSDSTGIIHEYNSFKFLVSEKYEDFIYYTSKIALPFFSKNNLPLEAAYYSEILAEHFKENRKYKLSSFYFEKSQNLLKNNVKNF